MAGLLGMALLVLCGCPRKGNDAPKDGAAPDASDAAASESTPSDDIEPVYPIEPNAPAEPLATKLCEGLTTTPEKKRSTCCKTTPAIVTTSECTRALSAAIRHRAVTVDEKDIDACLTAYDHTLEGCDWVGPFPPGPPAACEGILKGKLAAGRSVARHSSARATCAAPSRADEPRDVRGARQGGRERRRHGRPARGLHASDRRRQAPP